MYDDVGFHERDEPRDRVCVGEVAGFEANVAGDALGVEVRRYDFHTAPGQRADHVAAHLPRGPRQ